MTKGLMVEGGSGHRICVSGRKEHEEKEFGVRRERGHATRKFNGPSEANAAQLTTRREGLTAALKIQVKNDLNYTYIIKDVTLWQKKENRVIS